ncbi:ABC transporter substrate-binding protein, partial [archaeon]
APYWILGDPADGEWHMYTGGWITTVVSRDDADNFAFFYTDMGFSWSPLWQAYSPSDEFYNVAKQLAEKRFHSMDERNQLMRQAFQYAIQDSVRVWLTDQTAVWARRKNIDAVLDLAAGYATPSWPFTLRKEGEEGGTVTIGNSEVIVEPWNPVAGSNWIYDTCIQWATGYEGVGSASMAFLRHPTTGLQVPLHVESVDMEIVEDAVTFSNPESEDWLTFQRVSSVQVPSDAWYAWDTTNKKIVTAGEAGVTAAKAKVVINYGDVLGNVKYHDGSVMTLADWVVGFPYIFERVDETSPLYDEAAVPDFSVWRNLFIAFKIQSEHPLIIEYYVNYTALDAEDVVHWASDWPSIPWHILAIGLEAEAKGLLAFSADKAEAKEVEQTNYIGGPSLNILSQMLDEAESEGYIPFSELLGEYVSTDDAKDRYSKLKTWYEERGHFWVSNGPYYLHSVDITAHTAHLRSVAKYLVEQPLISTELLIIIVVVVVVAIVAVYWYLRKRKAEEAESKE